MAITLFDASLALAKIVDEVVESAATGGSTTTLVDATKTAGQDRYRRGTLWFKTGELAGRTRQVSTFIASSQTFNFTAIGILAVAAGNRYAAVGSRYEHTALVQALNQAAHSLVPAPSAFDETITIQENVYQYPLPAGVSNIRRLWEAQNDASPYWWAKVVQPWREVAGVLYLDDHSYWQVGRKLRLEYPAVHTDAVDDDDEFPDYMHIDRLIWNAAVHLLRIVYRNPEAEAATLWQEAINNAARMDSLHPINQQGSDQPDPILGSWNT